MSQLNVISVAFHWNCSFLFSAGSVNIKDLSEQRQTFAYKLETSAAIILLSQRVLRRFLISSGLVNIGMTINFHPQKKKKAKRKLELFLLIPTASLQPPPLCAFSRTHLPHTPASPLSRTGLDKYQPFRGFCVRGGLERGDVPGGPANPPTVLQL